MYKKKSISNLHNFELHKFYPTLTQFHPGFFEIEFLIYYNFF
jgi:hypothetical protein